VSLNNIKQRDAQREASGEGQASSWLLLAGIGVAIGIVAVRCFVFYDMFCFITVDNVVVGRCIGEEIKELSHRFEINATTIRCDARVWSDVAYARLIAFVTGFRLAFAAAAVVRSSRRATPVSTFALLAFAARLHISILSLS
jgi:hypothetical protein